MSNVRDFGAKGDGKTDDTDAIAHAVAEGDGALVFPRGDYRITRTIPVKLEEAGRTAIDGSGGGAKVIMAGPGPAFRLTGTHGGTGNPTTVKPEVWASQRLPTVRGIEIEGAHAEADGFELIQTMQSVIESVLVRRVRDGIRLHQRNRNVLINHCHVYDNRGVGIFLDRVDLHQINITGNHVSYNGRGGIRIEGSAIRNLQITGNDIEYNNQSGLPTAEIYVDCTAKGSSVAEVTVASNTIQATPSDGGANIRIVGDPEGRAPDLWTISGNVIGNQENSVHLTACRGIVITGNFIYSSRSRNLLVEGCREITVGSNNFRRHTSRLGTGVRFVDSTDCTLSGCTFRDLAGEGQASKASLLEMVDCRRMNVTGCQFLDGVPYGIDAERCRFVNVTGCTALDTRENRKSEGTIRFRGEGEANLITGCTLGKGLQLDAAAGVRLGENLTDL